MVSKEYAIMLTKGKYDEFYRCGRSDLAGRARKNSLSGTERCGRNWPLFENHYILLGSTCIKRVKMNDRRRINGPSGGTKAPVYSKKSPQNPQGVSDTPVRTRRSDGLRKMCMWSLH